MLQSLREHQASLQWFERSLALCIQFHGKDSLNTASLSFQYSQALALAQDPISAVPKMRDAYMIFAKKLGPGDRATKEAEFLLGHLTTNAVTMAKLEKLGKKVSTPNAKVDSAIKSIGPEIDGLASRGHQNIDELVKYIGAVEVGDTQRMAHKKRRGGKR
jgi:protein TIF31